MLILGLGVVDYQAVDKNVCKKLKQPRGAYKTYSNKDRFLIGKDASMNGPAKTTRKWKKTYPNLNESTVREFKKRYEAHISDADRKKKSPKKVIVNKLRGRPCLLGDKIDPLVQNYLKATRHKGGVVNSLVAIATAKALLKRYPRLEKEGLKIERSWAQSLFRRMGFVRRMRTTGKVHIPIGAQREAELKFFHQVVNKVEKYQIPPSLIINFDQTPSKYVQVSSMTMTERGEKNVPISGANDKRSITATFSITFDNKFLPMQLIYKGKTKQSLPKVDFPDGFSLSANKTHYSNEGEALKFINEIVLPYVQKERGKLGCENQKALLIFDVFRGQTTDKILNVLKDNHLLVTKVPANMTHLFQPLDLTVNKAAKDYTRDKFSDWFTRQINTGLENGQELDDIEVDYRLSVLKPLHAKWLISFYNHMTTTKGQEVISNGWKKSGIYDAITLGSNKLPPLDPFADLCPLIEAFQPSETLSLTSLFPQELDLYRWRAADETDDESSEWECDEVAEVDGNALDLFS